MNCQSLVSLLFRRKQPSKRTSQLCCGGCPIRSMHSEVNSNPGNLNQICNNCRSLMEFIVRIEATPDYDYEHIPAEDEFDPLESEEERYEREQKNDDYGQYDD